MHHRNQRLCLDEIVTRFNYVLRIDQSIALFDQILTFALKHFSQIQWLSSFIDVSVGLYVLMIDLQGQISLDERLYEKLVVTLHVRSADSNRLLDGVGIVRWTIRLIRRMSTSCFKDFDPLEIFLKQIDSTECDRRVIEQILKVNLPSFTCLIELCLCLRNVEMMSLKICLIPSIHR